MNSSFVPGLKIKSASQDSGFDEKEIISKVEKLENENNRLRRDEKLLLSDLNQIQSQVQARGAIGVNINAVCRVPV